MKNKGKVMEELGHATSESLDFLLPSGDNIIAVMGGTTMAKVADQMTKSFVQRSTSDLCPCKRRHWRSCEYSSEYDKFSNG